MCDKKKKNKKKKEKKTKKLSQFLKSHISGTREAISLKFGMWSAAVGGHVHSKNRLVSSRKHRATEVRKLRFLSSCQYTHGCYAPASWAARHTTVCLDVNFFSLKGKVTRHFHATLRKSWKYLQCPVILNIIEHPLHPQKLNRYTKECGLQQWISYALVSHFPAPVFLWIVSVHSPQEKKGAGSCNMIMQHNCKWIVKYCVILVYKLAPHLLPASTCSCTHGGHELKILY